MVEERDCSFRERGVGLWALQLHLPSLGNYCNDALSMTKRYFTSFLSKRS